MPHPPTSEEKMINCHAAMPHCKLYSVLPAPAYMWRAPAIHASVPALSPPCSGASGEEADSNFWVNLSLA